MNQTIAKRIEEVRHGDIPEGYVLENHQLRPTDWQYEKIGKYLVPYDEFTNDTEAYPLATSSRQGLMLQSEYYSDQRYEETSGGFHLVPEGYVTYRHMSDDDIFRFNVNRMGTPVLVSPEYPVFTTREGLNQELLVAYLNNMKEFRAYCSAQKKGSTRTRMYFSRLGEFAMPIPPLAEQQKIAEILSTCDRVIELKQQLLDEKRKQKQWLMQMLLDPDSGVRLPGFEGSKWMETTLGKIGEFYQPQTIAQNQLTNTGYPVFGANGQIGYYSEYNHERPQILITCRGATCGQVNMSLPYSWINGNAMVFNVDNNALFSKEFLYYLCDHLDFTSIISGSGQPQITALPLEKYKASVPSIKEQESLAQLFKTMDEGINFIAEELEAWQQKKKALMQLLLTGLVRVNA